MARPWRPSLKLHLLEILQSILSAFRGSSQQEGTTLKISSNIYFFYTLKDVTMSFGFYNMLPVYSGERGTLRTRKSVTGKFGFDLVRGGLVYSFTNYLKDLSRLENASLKEMGLSSGIPEGVKASLDLYKSCMSKALQHETLLFVQYGMNDAFLLEQILCNKVKAYNSIMLDYNIPKKALFTEYTIPLKNCKRYLAEVLLLQRIRC